MRVATRPLYTIIVMPVALKKLAFVLLVAALPLHALAAIVTPLCPQDAAGESSDDHAHYVGHQHDRDAPAHDHGDPLTANDLGSGHCGVGSTFALPAASVGCATGSTGQRNSFTAAHYFGFFPEQPQHPPRA